MATTSDSGGDEDRLRFTNLNGQSLQYGINRVFHMEQSREMRSTEFHYIDHPAMGIVILVEPIEVPPLAATRIRF